MYFQHSDRIWAEFPQLAAGVLYADGISPDARVESLVAEHVMAARSRLGSGTEAELPEVQAWRRAFAQMGFKPTQYRCASEALLRRFRKDGSIPRVHPVVDLCNAVSLATAVPVAVLDVANIAGDLEVRHASGDESYLTFAGAQEHPDADEVIFADGARQAHARRWVNRQSGLSAARATTTEVLVVVEALHQSAARDVEALITMLGEELVTAGSTVRANAVLSRSSPRFSFERRSSS